MFVMVEKMSTCARIVGCLLLAAVGLVQVEASGTNSYVLTLPCTVHPGIETRISLALLKGTGDVSVTATFRTDPSSRTKLSEGTMTVRAGQPSELRVETPSPPSGTSRLHLTVAGTGGLTFSNSTYVNVGKRFSIFVQTDKGVYRPGQTVRMRVLAVYPTLLAYTGLLDVAIEDKDKNRMAYWRNVTLSQGVWSEDFPLSPYPVLGNWTIKVNGEDSSTSVTFEVREYVLPKFEVSVTAPAYIAKDEFTDSQTITVAVSAKYTYGKPTRGTGTVNFWLNRVYQYCSREPIKRISRHFTLSADGKTTVSLSRKDFYQLFCDESSFGSYLNGYGMLVADTTVADSLNGEERTSAASIPLYGQRVQVTFDNAVSVSTFKPGSNYIARILVSTPDKKPINSTKVELSYTFHSRTSGSSSKTNTWTGTTRGGIAVHTISIPLDTSSVYMTATVGSSSAYNSPQLLISPSRTYLTLSANKASYATNQTATFTARATSTFSTLFYSVYSRGSQVLQSQASPAQSQKDVTFTLLITPDMAPNAKVVAYFVHSTGEIVVDSLAVTVSNIFSNNVAVSFDVAEARPNTNVTLSVSADAGSHVAVAIVDRSSLLLGKNNEITQKAVTDDIGRYDGTARPIFYDGPVWAFERILARRRKRTVLPYPWYYGGQSAGRIFGNAGVCVMTDCILPNSGFSVYVNGFGGNNLLAGAAPEISQQDSSSKSSGTRVGQSLAVAEHTRDFFPETWLWSSKVATAGGKADFSATVPDSITSWEASAFAMSSTSGLGVAPSRASLRAFQPFFISLNLPYSVIRGEDLALQVNIFNYLETAQETFVTLRATTELEVVGVKIGQDVRKTVTIPANEAASVFFTVTPKVIGHVTVAVTAQTTSAADSVRRQLLVEAEGVAKSYSRGVFIDLSQSGAMSEVLQLTVPSNTVPGSARAIVSVVGDIMGPALNNLDKLLKMPYGCGEQNMLNFAPDIFIIKYLTAIGQATSAIVSKAKRYMTAGYQRELTYMRRDASFSAFGDRDPVGSLWLTAFVTKSFAQARNYIYIDPNVIMRSLRYLVGQQRSDGSFPLVGMVHHQGLKGGIQGDVARTAYVLTTLLESQTYAAELETTSVASAVNKARAYVENSINSITDNYTLAISAYALQLAKSSMAPRALQLLLSRADRTGGTIRWHDSRVKVLSKRSWSPPWRRAPSADIELTAYGLLALVRSGDHINGLLVAKWLSTQRNAFGGFDSTQDTVVALQALAELAETLRAASPVMTVQLQSNSAATPFSQSFTVARDNSLVLQQTTDVPVPSQLTVSATGSGTAIVTVEVFYNVPTSDVVAFDINSECSLWVLKGTSQLGATCTFCTKVSTEGAAVGAAGMSLVEIGLPSGFTADSSSLQKVVTANMAKRVETPDRRVVFYVDELTKSNLCLKFDLQQNVLLSRLQATPVRAINYYDPSVSASLLYNLTTRALNICCQCKTCDGCSTFNAATCPPVAERVIDNGSSAPAMLHSVFVIVSSVVVAIALLF